jgi:glucosamine--fructose-6-phosphate aminotransferase (isomerizing)
MCGIVGYTGARPALPLLLEGLGRLEYRGYDSTGVCLVDWAGLHRVRAAANLAALRLEVASEALPPATAGIGHTRWATHGEVSVANTHPFTGCPGGPYAVALNGIVENFAQLRDQLVAAGHRFESTTDAEVVAHLLEEHAHLEPADALTAVADLLAGRFAIVAVDARRPGMVVGTRRQVPLVVGLGDDEQFFCSSVDAVLSETRRFWVLDDDDVAVLEGRTATVVRPDGTVVVPEELVVDRPTVAVGHQGFGSHMAKEMDEQPTAIGQTLAGRIDGPRVHLAELTDAQGRPAFDAAAFDRLVLVGCGTALHAGSATRAMFEGWARLHTEVAVASEWRYAEPMVGPRTLVVAISQSGETADTLEAARLARMKGAFVIGMTNMADSQLTREVDSTLLTRAGLEVSVAATKTFTAQVTLLALLAFQLGTWRETLCAEEAEAVLIELELIGAKMQGQLARSSQVRRLAADLEHAPFVVFVGRRSGVPVALEGALKLREVAYVPSEVHAAGELKHGSIALIEPGTPVVAVMTAGTEPERTLSTLHEVRARGAYVIAVATEGHDEVARVADEVVWVPATHPLLEPLLSVVPLQQLAHDVAQVRGLNVDQPRNLAKTVTVE